MQITLISQGLNQPPQNPPRDHIKYVVDATMVEHMTFCVIEKGMASGDPSVIIEVTLDDTLIAVQTSLDKLIAATIGLKAMAETRFGWVQEEGVFSLVPTYSEEQKKALLEAIKRELES